MYSPKIPERLIPALYRLARSRGQPITKIVAEALEAYLASQNAVIGRTDDPRSHSDASLPAEKAA